MDFIRAARSLFSQVIQGFQKEAGTNWRFIDVLEACIDERSLKQALALTRLGRAKTEGILGGGEAQKQAKGVLFTLQAAVETLAARECHR